MRKKNYNGKPNAKGRSYTSRFVRLEHSLLISNAYRALKPLARALIIEISMLYNGNNNGSLYLSVRDAADRLGVADHSSVTSAFDQLQEFGFIEISKEAHFSVKASHLSRARCWRLTWESAVGKRRPSFAYLKREPKPQTRDRKRMEKGLRALKRYRKDLDSNRLPVLENDILVPDAYLSGIGNPHTQEQHP